MRVKTCIVKSVVAAIAAVGISGAAAHGAVIANWTIETAPPADLANSAVGPTVAADSGAGALNGVHASALTDWSTPVGNGSFNSYSSNEWAIGDYYQVQVSTTGLDDIWIQWDQTRSSTGPATWDLQYSTDGATFTTFLDNYSVPSISWSSGTADVTGTTSFVADTTGI